MTAKFMALCAVVLIVASPLRPEPGSQSRNGGAQAKPVDIQWIYNLDEGFAKAKEVHKPLMIEFMASWCPSCKEMEKKTFSSTSVRAKASAFVTVRIDIDQQREVAEKYNALAQKYGGIGIPNILFLTSDGKKLKHVVGYQSPKELLATMNSILALTQ